MLLLLFYYHRSREWDNPYAIKVNTTRQAVCPLLKPRPALPTAAEARHFGTPVHTPPAAAAAAAAGSSGQQQQQVAAGFRAAYVAEQDSGGRRALLQEWVERADEQLGPDRVKVRSFW